MSRIVARATKDGGEGLRRLGDKPLQEVASMTTGSLGLDMALGVGAGLVAASSDLRPGSRGKTTLLLHTIAAEQRAGRCVAFIDAEHALDTKYAAHLGVDTDNLYVMQPSTAEEALDVTCNLCEATLAEKQALGPPRPPKRPLTCPACCP